MKAITDNPLAGLLREYYTGARSEPDELIPQVVRAATRMLFVTDTQGHVVAALTDKPHFDNSSFVWWKGSYNRGIGQLYIEDVYFDELAGTYAFSISLPIMDSLRYEAVGVIHRMIDAKEFFRRPPMPIRFGKTGHVMLIDHRGIVVSCPILPTGVPALRCSDHPVGDSREPDGPARRAMAMEEVPHRSSDFPRCRRQAGIPMELRSRLMAYVCLAIIR